MEAHMAAQLFYAPDVDISYSSGEKLHTPITFGPFDSIAEVEEWQDKFLDEMAFLFKGNVIDIAAITKGRVCYNDLALPGFCISETSKDKNRLLSQKKKFKKVMTSKNLIITSAFPINFRDIPNIPVKSFGRVIMPTQESFNAVTTNLDGFLLDMHQEACATAERRLQSSREQQRLTY